MLLDLSDDILCEIIDYLEKPRKRRLAPPGHFAVVGPAWGKWRISDLSLYMLMITNRHFYFLTRDFKFKILESYYSKSRFFRKNKKNKKKIPRFLSFKIKVTNIIKYEHQ